MPSPPLRMAPSLLAADVTRLGDEVRAAEHAGADWFHLDVMDGHFVPNLSFGPLVVAAVRRVTGLPLDVHLMVANPEAHLAAFARAGASHISVHYEATPDVARTLSAVRALGGVRVGLAVNPHTPVALLGEVLPLLDQVIVMTVSPGFGGQALLADTLPKFGALRAMAAARGQTLDLIADGGVTPGTARTVLGAGANVLVAGSSVFGAEGGAAQGLAALRAACAS